MRGSAELPPFEVIGVFATLIALSGSEGRFGEMAMFALAVLVGVAPVVGRGQQ